MHATMSDPESFPNAANDNERVGGDLVVLGALESEFWVERVSEYSELVAYASAFELMTEVANENDRDVTRLIKAIDEGESPH